jgi:DNA-binding GntR family transcriptional regulator
MVNTFAVNKASYIPFRDGAYDLIKKMILKGHFKPGERLTENQLSKQLGVSRTPIRESIRKLAAEGLVDVFPKGGARVSELMKDDINEIYEIREVLETFATQKATSMITGKEIEALEKLLRESKKAFSDKDILKMAQINTKFHTLIYRASKNRRLIKLIDILCTNITRHRELILESGAKESIKGHEEILNALIKRDEKAAQKAIFNHIILGREILLRKFKNSP